MVSVPNPAAQRTTRKRSGGSRGPALNRVCDADPAALLVLDPSGRIRYLNQAARETLGVSLEQVRGSSWTNCINVVDRATRVPIEYPLKSIANSDTPTRTAFHAVIVSTLGSDVPVEVQVEPFPEPENSASVSGAVMTFYGISEIAPQQ
ncbi:MAG: PAS domain-containing protein [Gammaproteobacteria bacterium]|nr:PAS domain-containing protein [Gammaproteobacteria bacterium]